jgi:pimeloyl-ACP methyl ester carboxylesterase
MTIHSVTGGGGMKLHVREWGTPSGPPILFVHGWSQNHLCWARQYDSPLADEFRLVAFDLRGHGMSEAPGEPSHYTTARLWADDVAAIVDQLHLQGVVVVAWSYGGFVVCDYIRAYGQDALAGLNFVAGAVTLDPSTFGTLIGPGFLTHVEGATASDLPRNVESIRAFLRDVFAGPVDRNEFERALCWNMTVPASVRGSLLAREINSDDVLGSLRIPVLMTHGCVDTVLLPAMGQHILDQCPTARASWYEDVGHAPFVEDTRRFNRELAEFVGRAGAVRRGLPSRVAGAGRAAAPADVRNTDTRIPRASY